MPACQVLGVAVQDVGLEPHHHRLALLVRVAPAEELRAEREDEALQGLPPGRARHERVRGDAKLLLLRALRSGGARCEEPLLSAQCRTGVRSDLAHGPCGPSLRGSKGTCQMRYTEVVTTARHEKVKPMMLRPPPEAPAPEVMTTPSSRIDSERMMWPEVLMA